MAPRTIYEQPHVQLGRLAVIARREGRSFEEFWQRAVREHAPLVMASHPSPPEGAVRWPTDPRDRKTWRKAIIDSKDGWLRAYEGREAPAAERALRQLGEAFAALGVVAARAADELPAHGIEGRPAILSAA